MSVTLILTMLLAAGPATADSADQEAGTYYTYGQLGIKKTEAIGTKISFTFQPVAERSYWCPGVKIKETKKAVILTFVRCETFKTCPVDVEAKIGKRLIRTMSIDTRGKDTYVRNGPKRYKRIFSSEKKGGNNKKNSATTAEEVKQPTRLPSGTPINLRGPDKNGWIRNKLAVPSESTE